MSTQNQPRWAWWVVGIVIPLIGIVVSIKLAGDSGSDDKPAASSNAPADPAGGGTGGTTGGSGNAPAPPAQGAPSKLLYGPSDVTVGESSSHLVLDAEAPLAQSGEDGADLSMLFNIPPPALITADYAKTMAMLPAEGSEPTAADCAEAVSKRGTGSIEDLKSGMRFCVQTDEGRIAFVQVTRASLKAVTFRVTAWG
ncbi:hypothetical protein LO772_15630 [Yinghuangia sp. ASG 101]|uniref:hypothetical protein n=1 Tax=Yinghuangia sp. ASG 101 TaxID=2896848 RepID=UPI001E41A5F2|nr:hypothetical protein [Yinghuangia sp. ASG 101]UGQ14874.1 hypothetical protein LO772_15630 [Yinghuangia sp. ASG 101]